MKKQTAVEWLVEQLPLGIRMNLAENGIDLNQAKAIEKEQIIDSFVECWKENMPEGYECKQSAEYYYNETYG